MKSCGYLSRPIRVAVLFDQHLESGGGYQQALNAVGLLSALPAELIEPVYFTLFEESQRVLAEKGIVSKVLTISRLGYFSLIFRRFLKHPRLLRKWVKLFPENIFERCFSRENIDLVYFLSPNSLSANLERLNYIITVWDLCHRDDMEFPEVRSLREFEARELTYWSSLSKAIAVLTDSDLGKDNIVRRYGVDEERVHVMPFEAMPAIQIENTESSINVSKKYKLNLPYIFYPAQFWAHKNHIYVLEGLKILECEFGYQVGAIFSGGDKGNLAYIRSQVAALDLQSRIIFAGFVGDQEIKDLYCQSLALVMPTYFGPTNLPPLEAFELGTPVLYPDKKGLREQVSNAALLIDLQNPRSMALHLKSLIEEPELRTQLTAFGKERLENFSKESRSKILEKIFRNFQSRRICWE